MHTASSIHSSTRQNTRNSVSPTPRGGAAAASVNKKDGKKLKSLKSIDAPAMKAQTKKSRSKSPTTSSPGKKPLKKKASLLGSGSFKKEGIEALFDSYDRIKKE